MTEQVHTITHNKVDNSLLSSHAEDEQFMDEKQYLIKQIREMSPLSSTASADAATPHP